MSTLGLIGVVLRRTRPHLGRLALAVVCVMLAAALEVLKPWPLKVVIDNVLRGTPLSAAWPARAARLSPANLLIAACIGLVVLYTVLGLINVFNNYISISIGQRMVNDLRAELFDHLQRLSLSFHRGRPIGDLMVRIT
ncbi:MAG TPA: ABC transporter transmembrane domain-containing protein, partial [Candidatus Binataceae bacterium]|nr:ABC transporter transmembrane domain-containing protein [Candidatus Binataceae bacterium]